MPLLELVKEKYSDIDLHHTLLISCQHILPTNIILYRTLKEKGLQANNCYILGKCYSTNNDAFDILLSEGFQVSDLSKRFVSHESFDDQYKEYITVFLDNILANRNLHEFKQILVVDDGGVLLDHVVGCIAAGKIKDIKLVGIEQTSSGYTRLANKSIPFPIVNVARSAAKLDYESIHIAELAGEKIELILRDFPTNIQKILIIGGGPIGYNMKKYFSLKDPDIAVDIYDIVPEKSDILDNYLLENLANYDMIIGCTGVESFSKEYFLHMKSGVVLVSNSSSDREFAAISLRQKIPEYYNPHLNIKVDHVILFGSGFPIAFYGSGGLAPKYAQLTRSLMLAGILQAASSENTVTHGFIDLNKDTQAFITSEYSKCI